MTLKTLALVGGLALSTATAFAQTVVVTAASQSRRRHGDRAGQRNGHSRRVQPRGTPAEATDTPTGTNSTAGGGGNSTGTGGVGGSGNR